MSMIDRLCIVPAPVTAASRRYRWQIMGASGIGGGAVLTELNVARFCFTACRGLGGTGCFHDRQLDHPAGAAPVPGVGDGAGQAAPAPFAGQA